MAITLDKFRAKLLIKILYASSAYASQRYVHAAVGAMLRRNINGYTIASFINRVNLQLGNCKASNTDLQQCSNIRTAMYELQQLRGSIGCSSVNTSLYLQ